MTKNEPTNPATDWHRFQQPLKDPDEDSGEATEVDEKGKDCETCGQPTDALVHEVDDAGNPTREAQAKAAGVV
jgi:hypothetical protein